MIGAALQAETTPNKAGMSYHEVIFSRGCDFCGGAAKGNSVRKLRKSAPPDGKTEKNQAFSASAAGT